MASKRKGVKLIELLLVVLLLVGLASVLLPTLSRSRELAIEAGLESGEYYDRAAPALSPEQADKYVGGAPRRALAHVKNFDADIELTPRLSVGTAEPESIYEARFTASIAAINPGAAGQECEIQLPLPPQIISLADLNVTVNGEPSEEVFLRDGVLVWHGHIDKEKPASFKVTYTAMGKGIYMLHTPPGRIIDTFETKLVANRSDIRMLELSLQPVGFDRQKGKTIYTWKYNRLMLGRPIALDVLGIAPMDRLGELVWLGPISIFVFGILVALLGMAYRPERLDKWMLLLIAGAFTGAYPLMYFAQEFLSLPTAIFAAAAVVLAIIAARTVTLLGVKLGIAGIVLAGATLAITLAATIYPATQGALITIEAIGALVVAMILLPKVQKSLVAEPVPSESVQVGTEPAKGG